MKSSRFTNNDGRRVLIAMIVDDAVGARIAGKWRNEGLFDSRWENLIGTWCVEHLRKYGKAPGREIETIFANWASSHEDPDAVELVEKFLASLSNEYEAGVPDAAEYLIDLAGRYFERVRLAKVMEAAQGDLERGDLDAARDRIENGTRIELGLGSVSRPAEDFESWRAAFDEEQQKSIVTYPGAVGQFLGNDLSRDCFVAWLGAEKRGKSFDLMDLAFRGMKQRRKVAFFEVGDMSQGQVYKRLGQRAARLPRTAREVILPIEYSDSTKGPTMRRKRFEQGLTPQAAFNAFRKSCHNNPDNFRLMCYPNGTISSAGIRAELLDFERQGWTPDIVVIDYADILAPPAGMTAEGRDWINRTWMELRSLSQEFHCLVATATQADAKSYDKALLGRGNFTEDKRKLSHVTAMIGINSTDAERQLGVRRWNWIVRRDESYSESRQVYIAGCLAVGCPIIKSCF